MVPAPVYPTRTSWGQLCDVLPGPPVGDTLDRRPRKTVLFCNRLLTAPLGQQTPNLAHLLAGQLFGCPLFHRHVERVVGVRPREEVVRVEAAGHVALVQDRERTIQVEP